MSCKNSGQFLKKMADSWKKTGSWADVWKYASEAYFRPDSWNRPVSASFGQFRQVSRNSASFVKFPGIGIFFRIGHFFFYGRTIPISGIGIGHRMLWNYQICNSVRKCFYTTDCLHRYSDIHAALMPTFTDLTLVGTILHYRITILDTYLWNRNQKADRALYSISCSTKKSNRNQDFFVIVNVNYPYIHYSLHMIRRLYRYSWPGRGVWTLSLPRNTQCGWIRTIVKKMMVNSKSRSDTFSDRFRNNP